MTKTILFCLFATALGAQPLFQKKIVGLQQAEGLAIMPDGGLMLAGLQANCIQIIRFDPIGSPVWMRQVCPSNSGLDISIGKLQLQADESQPGAFLLIFRKGAFSSVPDNLFNLMKFDAAGNLLWECQLRPDKRYGPLSPGSQMATTPSGNTWSAHAMGFTDQFPDFNQALVFKVSPTGQLLLRRYFQTDIPATANGIVTTNDQEIYVYGGLDHAAKDGFVLKINELGEVLWAKRYTGFHLLRDGGHFPNEDVLLVADFNHAFALLRMDGAGAVQWAWKITDSLSVFHAAALPDGDVLISGRKSQGNFILGKLAAKTGQIQWAKTYEACTQYQTNALLLAADGGPVIAQSTGFGNSNARMIKTDTSGNVSAECPAWAFRLAPLISVPCPGIPIQFSSTEEQKEDSGPIFSLSATSLEIKDCCATEYPAAQFMVPDSVCAGTLFDLISTGNNCSDEWHWEAQGASPMTGEGAVFQDISFSDVGMYEVRLTESTGTCRDTFTANLNVIESPKLSLFNVSDTTICPDAAFVFTPNLSGLQSWRWENGSTAPVFVLDPPQENTIRLTGYAGLCAVTDSLRVHFGDCGPSQIYIPNAFSPDEDGSNDLWETYLHTGLYPLQCQIFDRWGNQCYASESGEVPRWDGRWKGRALPPGVYVWQFRLRNANGIEERLSGDLLLIR